MVSQDILDRRKKVLGEFDGNKYDFLLRQIPITALIYETAISLGVEDKVIRAALITRMGVYQSRASQIENQASGKLKKKHIDTINGFFTEALGRPVDITAAVRVAGGLFSDLV